MRFLDLGERKVIKWLREWLINHPKSRALERYRRSNSLGDRTVGIREEGYEGDAMALEERDVLLTMTHHEEEITNVDPFESDPRRSRIQRNSDSGHVDVGPIQDHPLRERISIDSGEHTTLLSKNILHKISQREIHAPSFSKTDKVNILIHYLPDTLTDVLFDYDDHIFVGNFSKEGDRFVSAAQGTSSMCYVLRR
jgi:hypothetical protein